MNPHFLRRSRCPACSSDDLRLRYRRTYTDPIIAAYLDSFYESRVEVEYLEGASYSLCQCNSCGMIFQQEVPDDPLMERLYEGWIDPDLSFARHLTHTLTQTSSVAADVMQTIALANRPASEIQLLDFGMGWDGGL